MEIIDQMNREKVLYCVSVFRFLFGSFISSGLRGYFGVGSGTHYMYSRKDLGTNRDITRDTTR